MKNNNLKILIINHSTLKQIIIFYAALFLFACHADSPKSATKQQTTKPVAATTQNLIEEKGSTIQERINTPTNFQRNKVAENSFQEYLRTLPLKPAGSKVLYHNGATKPNNEVYEAVVDLAIGTKDLHQCADAVMRLKAEYLWQQKKYDQIHFNFTNGFRVDYTEWMKGKRIKVDGNKTSWINKTTPTNTYQDFWKYLEIIFMYAGTASLEKELISVDIQAAEIGDVLIQGGHPGHAVIIVDKAKNQTTGENIFLLAQSYMPAQEIQILINSENDKLSPWYELKEGAIRTPEWGFESSDLRRFTE